MSSEYAEALISLRKEALSCSNENRFVIDLEDGSKRLTLARDDDDNFPECVQKNVLKISKQFDKIDQFINITADEQRIDFHQLATRTHLHTYLSQPGRENSLIHDNVNLLSVPFHTDKGLYLLLTPSEMYPLKIVSKEGDVIDMEKTDTSVICLMGTGLTEWLLPDLGLFSPPHAVPALEYPSARTVLARMKVAPLDARNINSEATFGEHFYSVLHQSAKTTMEQRHLERVRRQVDHDISQHWPGQVSQQNVTGDN